MSRKNHIYLDHAAGTFLLPEVKTDIISFMEHEISNPSSIHQSGRHTAGKLDAARLGIAQILGCKPSEIIFTSGGTEANNLAIRGLAQAHPANGKHIISCGTEHPSVLESLKQLEEEGHRLSLLKTDKFGRIDLNELESTICEETCLITLMWVNNETGLVHPIQDIAKIAQEHAIPFHSDAVQALGHFPINVNDFAVDALSFAGHKIGAPAGIGVLYLRKGNNLKPQLLGGKQENNHRAGTPNTLGSIAFSSALKYHYNCFDNNQRHYETLQLLLQKNLSHIPDIQINRDNFAYSAHILSCSFHSVDGEALFIRLDMSNSSVSNGSACSSGSQAPSHVLTSLGFSRSLAQASLRVSFGVQTTPEEVDSFSQKLAEIIKSIKRDL